MCSWSLCTACPRPGRFAGTCSRFADRIPNTRLFAVAAIRIDKSDPSARSHIISSSKDSHFRAINVTLKSLLQWAFLIPDTRILGGPAWLDSTKFDIEATSDPSVDEQLSMGSTLPTAGSRSRRCCIASR